MADSATVSSPGDQDPFRIVRQGRHVRMRGVATDDYDWLYDIAVNSDFAHRWRWRGTTPRPDDFIRLLWDDVAVQYVIETRSGPVGMVSCYNVNPANGTGYFAAVARPEYHDTGLLVEGTVLFLDYVFATLDLRKLYFEVLAENLPAFQSAVGRYLIEEGRLAGHERIGCHYTDLHIFALYRDRWATDGERLRKYVTGTR